PIYHTQWDAIPRHFRREMSSSSVNPPLEGTTGVPSKEKPLANSPPIVIPTPTDSTQSSGKAESNRLLLDSAHPGSAPPPPQVQRTRPRLRASKAAMTLTPTAVTRLRTLLSGPTPQYIRVGVRNKGCAGMSYHLEYVDKPSKFDEQVEQDGVKVLIDSKALFSIIGSEMDWVEDKLRCVMVIVIVFGADCGVAPNLRSRIRMSRMRVGVESRSTCSLALTRNIQLAIMNFSPLNRGIWFVSLSLDVMQYLYIKSLKVKLCAILTEELYPIASPVSPTARHDPDPEREEKRALQGSNVTNILGLLQKSCRQNWKGLQGNGNGGTCMSSLMNLKDKGRGMDTPTIQASKIT
ncbi:12363_t:CDS:2, partial [Acaulospora colombiana]